MKAENKNTADVQGADAVMKKQATSISYTMKATAKNITKLKELDLITDEEFNQMKEVHKNAANRWLGEKMFE